MYYNGRHFHATIEYIIKKFEELNLDIIVIITVNNLPSHTKEYKGFLTRENNVDIS